MVEKNERLGVLEEVGQPTVVDQWIILSTRQKTAVVGAFTASVIIVSCFTAWNTAFGMFPYGSLSPGQIMAFIICTFFCVWAAADALAILLHPLEQLLPSKESRTRLRSAVEFSGYMFLMFFCDRTAVLGRSEKWYSADYFWFLWISLVAISLCTVTKAKTPVSLVVNGQPALEVFHVPPLARLQTEEWKGWMQVLFLWYHYFHAESIYNSIRLFIAAYIWMTGFGNFSYYYVRKDFSLSRFCDMQWRLNFFVASTCLILQNEYMLYYICPLHTLFTLMIYGTLRFAQNLNITNVGITIKVIFLFVVCFFLWDVSEGLFKNIWFPLKWLVRYDDPYRPDRDVLSEWFFRTFLDHYIWIYGMVCAYCHPCYDGYLRKLDDLPKYTSWAIKIVITMLALTIGYIYVTTVYLSPKKEYNKIHPYTSFIPITIYLLIRNIFMRARMYHIELFANLGKVTLETYIAQFHIWMLTTGVNGSPKLLLRVLPDGYPMLNFAITSIVFSVVSFRLFTVTNDMRSFLFPPKAAASTLKVNMGMSCIVLLGMYALSCGVSVFIL